MNLVQIAQKKNITLKNKNQDLIIRRQSTWGTTKFRRFKLRTTIQIGMIFLCIWIGLELYFFAYTAMYRNGLPLPTRPAGVDGFLPITGLMGLYDWFQFGELNTVHPSATILLITFIIISFIFRKTFCSWLCPIGTLSEWLATLGRKILKKNFKLTKWMDYPLRSLKYLLFFFFLYSIFAMGKWGVHYFLHSPYNKVADVKMGLFFIQLGTIGAIVLIVLVIASILIYNFWCRYLCPYGALLGFFSFFSPLQVTRNADDCTDCGICNQVCSANLPIMSKNKIYSVECTGCFDCVASCPIPSALTTKMVHKKVKISFIGIGLVSIFIGIWLLAKVTDHWDNKISDQEYRKLIKNINEYSHPGRK